MKQFIKQLAIGFSRQIWRFFASAFIAYSVIWTVLESLSLLFPTLKPEGWIYFLAMIVAGLVWGTYRVFPRQRIHLRFKAIDTTIEVEFGDLFQSQGLKVIPVNEFFDSDLGDHVSPRSLHGQLIKRFFGSYPAAFDALVEKELKDKPHDSLNRKSGKEKRYPIGTTPVIKVDEDRFFLPALCHTDINTLKASCDVPTLWRALAGLWSAVRNRAGGEPVSVPLIGGGQAGIGLPPSQLLQLIILSIVSASKERPISSLIRVVLPHERFEEIDLDMLDKYWR